MFQPPSPSSQPSPPSQPSQASLPSLPSSPSADESVRHYAGVLISIDPARLTEVRRSLDSIPGIAVHHLDPASGRCVAVLESADRTQGERLFAEVSHLLHVRSVDLVYHLVDREAAGSSESPAPTETVFPEPKP